MFASDPARPHPEKNDILYPASLQAIQSNEIWKAIQDAWIALDTVTSYPKIMIE